jgi:hypothetical protein
MASRIVVLLILLTGILQPVFALTDSEIRLLQPSIAGKPLGERIAFWAEQFAGTPYDRDPMGEYVTRAAIVADERIDCMYLTYRAAELGLGETPEKAVEAALDLRFHTKGVLKDGKVMNYEDRFEDGEDMVRSGKWGREVTSDLGRTARIRGRNGREFIVYLPRSGVRAAMGLLKSGDVIFFVKDPAKRVRGEIIAHLGVIKVEEESGHARRVYFIHAAGTKARGGAVKKQPLEDYVSAMQHPGAKITRFE